MNHKERCEVHYGLPDAVINSMRLGHDFLRERGLREDLRSIGLEAMVVASTKFDESKGVLFKTYASSRIRGKVMHHLSNLRNSKEIGLYGLPEVILDRQMKNLEGEPIETYDWTLVDSLAPEDEINKALYYEYLMGDRSIRDICNDSGITVKAGRRRVERLKKKLKEILNENQG